MASHPDQLTPSVCAQAWPVFKSYHQTHLRRIALPLGGIGTGTLALGGRGNLKNFEIVNRPALGFTPHNTFFAIRTQSLDDSGEKTVFCRALEGPIAPEDYEGVAGCEEPNHGLPRFQNAVFRAAYPLGEVVLEDENCPLDVILQAFNPFVVGDTQKSGFPVAVLRFALHNPTPHAVEASICASLGNFLGSDGVDKAEAENSNEFRRENGVCALLGQSNLAPDSRFFGTLALGILDETDFEVSHRTSWAKKSWGDSLLDFWDDFAGDGRLENREREDQNAPTASLCAATRLEAGETRHWTFVLAWHFPNRLSWTPAGLAQTAPEDGIWANEQGGDCVGNFYTTRFSDALDVLRKFAPQRGELEEQTVAFARAFYGSDLPTEIKEAAGFNLSTLRSNTLFQTADGHFFGWEGLGKKFGSCFGSCTHVWNYEQATAFLFPEIARDFREIEFLHATNAETGLMSFRVGLPLQSAARSACDIAAADGQTGCLLKLHREWKLSGDTEFLRRLWPQAKRALEWCWVEGGWDGDRDGVMEGCQHNTMDVEYYGPNPQMQFLYLGALAAMSEMATALDEPVFARQCEQIRAAGLAWTRDNLWNGEYFEHQIRPTTPDKIASGLRHIMGADDLTNPALQLGSGCLVDQLFGEWLAQIGGLPPAISIDRAQTTLASILKYNRRDRASFNHLRSFSLGDEDALLMASYPRGNRPERPFPYFNESMTGFEHVVAAHLLVLGETESALRVIGDIRSRYNGRKRNPFDESECGRHYARAMASWGHVLGFTGFDYDARTATMRFRAARENSTWFWSIGAAWGIIIQSPQEERIAVEIRVCGGELSLREFELSGFAKHVFKGVQSVREGEELRIFISVL
jgi:uncharacterized protein (DUF608 family)